MNLKTVLVAAVTGATLLCSANAMAQTTAKKPASAAQMAQRDKMKSCNADAKAKSMTGDDRKAFMKTCLSGDAAAMPATMATAPAAMAPAAAAPAGDQKTKMKTCNADATAKSLKGDDRKAYMKTCLTAG